MIYRDRERPYPKPPAELLEAWTYMVGNPASTWVQSEEWREKYARLYGASALIRAVTFNLVCENRDAAFVYRSNWKGKTWSEEEPDAPVKPTWEGQSVVLSAADRLILQALNETLGKLDEILGKLSAS